MDDIQKEHPELHFYYSHEEHVRKASPAVKAMWAGPQKKSFFKALTETGGRRATFISLVCIFVMLLFVTMRQDAIASFDGNKMTAVAVAMPTKSGTEETYIVLRKAAARTKAYNGIVGVEVYADSKKTKVAQKPLKTEQIVFTDKKNEEFRLALDGAQKDLRIVLFSEDGKKTFTLRVKAQ
jgi:hypothetical protein